MPADRRATRTVHVGLDARAYDIHVGAGLTATVGRRISDALGHAAAPGPRRTRRAFLIHDTGVPREAVDAAAASLTDAGYLIGAAPYAPSEGDKSLAAAERLLVAVARSRHERGDPIVALGGGITGDIAGFVAATYRRGVPLVHCPTTLLSMVDASVGGKTGVNLHIPPDEEGLGERLLKNAAGAFHQPSLVVCDVALLRTLPMEEFACGLAECIKHGLLAADWRDPDLLAWTSANLPATLAHDEPALIELVARNVTVKAAVVAADEREEGVGPGGGRLALNMGHTFGHALETLEPDRPLRHGEAVALGLIAEAACGEHLGVTRTGTSGALRALIGRAGLPTHLAPLPPAAELLDRMRDDKKTASGRLRLALPTGDGRCRIAVDPSDDALAAGVEALRG